jgi:nucleotide-binding universal stress UspA family protein
MALFPSSSIMVPLDLSASSLAALDQAAELAESPAALHIASVLPTLAPLEPGVAWGTINDASRVASMTAAITKELTQRGLSDASVHVVVEPGNAGRHLAALAKDLEVKAIVMSSHGRTGWKRFTMGSVAELVVRFADCPTVVVRST